MRCAICGQRDVDGAIDSGGDYVCVDCWANGEAYMGGRIAQRFVPASCPVHVHYPADMQRKFVDACNQPNLSQNSCPTTGPGAAR